LHIKDFLSNLDCTATNERALREWWNGEDVT
jgi:hypothetical protein